MGFKDSLLIGCGSGFSHDRPDAGRAVAEYLVKHGGGYLIYETLAERTVALAQLAYRAKLSFGRLSELLTHTLPLCLNGGVKIIGNFGAANPGHATTTILNLARKLRIKKPRVGVVTGDNLLSYEKSREWLGEYLPPGKDPTKIVSANVYIGADGIVQALRNNADIVVVGRAADPSLTLAAIMHAHNIDFDDRQQLALGTLAGHLLECGAQVSGGYFCDPGIKNVHKLDSVGFPVARVDTARRRITICKPSGTGGLVSAGVVKEQLLYEIHNPRAYHTPDVTLDISAVQVTEEAPNRVCVRGMIGRRRPDKLRLQICLEDGWGGEAEISYYGQTAPARAALACDILRRRLRKHFSGLRYELDVIGLSGVAAGATLSRRLNQAQSDANRAHDLRVRLAARDLDKTRLQRALWEVETLYTNGPAGGGGVRTTMTSYLAHHIALVPREKVRIEVQMR